MSLRDVVRRRVADGYRRVPFGVARGTRLPGSQGLREALGLVELEIAPYVRAMVGRGSVCYDVGAARGYYAVALARRVASGRVVCFEPDAGAYTELEQTLEHNPEVADRIEPVNMGLGAQRSDRVTTIDEFVAGSPSGPPDFLKIDVDGPEHDVLMGGRMTVARHQPRFIIETHGFDIEARCLGFLTEHDYGYRAINPRRFWPEHRPIEVNRWVAAVHRSDHLFPLVCN